MLRAAFYGVNEKVLPAGMRPSLKDERVLGTQKNVKIVMDEIGKAEGKTFTLESIWKDVHREDGKHKRQRVSGRNALVWSERQ